MKKIRFIIVAAICGMLSFTSCSDFFDEDSTYVIDANSNHLNNATDTLYSVIGILNKLQAIGDRTILLGEVRGDLMSVTQSTASDLRDVAEFNIGDDNMYNVPRDYYAVINNCNYFIAHADTAMRNNRNENIFKKEYAAVKAIRAWVYLQLVTTYGQVPFVTEPLLTKEQAEQQFPMKDIQGVCDYFLDEDGLTALVDQEYPNYGDVKGINSPLFFFPMRLVLGDLCLWSGRYLEAAQYYYGYIDKRNGVNSSYAISTNRSYWMDDEWFTYGFYLWSMREYYMPQEEIINIIPMDSIPSEGYYSQLRELMSTSSDNDYKRALMPSEAMQTLSANQDYTYYDSSNGKYVIAPKNMAEKSLSGDLRLAAFWRTSENAVDDNNNKYTRQSMYKFYTRNVHIYRRGLVYLRLAEALNSAGYPHYAYHLLRTGVNKNIVTDSIAPHYSEDEAQMLLAQFPFPSARYMVYEAHNAFSGSNTMGIHSRGSGDYDWNGDTKVERMPNNPNLTGEELIKWQQRKVEEMLVDEQALELAFEGFRFYDLMRVAMRRNDNSYLADKIARRDGTLNSVLKSKLEDRNNWFLKWNGQIGGLGY